MYHKIIKQEVIDSLARHRDVTEAFLKTVDTIPATILENKGSFEAVRAVQMSREVTSELFSYKAFLRLKLAPRGILYASIPNMKHHNEQKLVEFFKQRFPTFCIILESKGFIYIGRNSPQVIIKRINLEQAITEEEMLRPEDNTDDFLHENYQQLWENYALSQVIPEKGESDAINRLQKKWNDNKITKKVVPTKDLTKYFKNPNCSEK